MFSEPGSCSFFGVSSNSSVFVTDKDLNSNMDRDEFGLLVRRPAMEFHKEEHCQTSTLEEDHREQLSVQERDQEEHNKEHQEQEDKKEQGNVIISVPLALPSLKNLKLEIPSYEDGSNEGFKTPTSSSQKIPVFLECPGAPRKRKSRPAKQRRTCRRRIALDVSKEMESLFPMPFVADLCASGKNKKLKHC